MGDTLLADSDELIAREERRCHSIDQPADHIRVIKDGHTFGAVLALFLAWTTGSRFWPGHTSNGWAEVACEDEGGRQYFSVSSIRDLFFESHTILSSALIGPWRCFRINQYGWPKGEFAKTRVRSGTSHVLDYVYYRCKDTNLTRTLLFGGKRLSCTIQLVGWED